MTSLAGTSRSDVQRVQTCKFFDADGHWQDLTIARSPASEEASTFRKETQVDQQLLSALSADRLLVLAGLGTSLGIDIPDGGQTAPTMWDLWQAVSRLDGFDAAVEVKEGLADQKNVEALLSACQFRLALRDDPTIQSFLREAEVEILRLCSFVNGGADLTEHEVFLRRIARRQARLSRAQIFTTNYDLAFEYAAAETGFYLIDGFGPGPRGRFDARNYDLDLVRRRNGAAPAFEPNVAHLYKLHGSVDWNSDDSGIERTINPDKPVLIYPASSKYQLSYEQPYMECLARFQMALREQDVSLIVAGFGFNDDHIVAPIDAAIRSNVGLRLVVVAPDLSTTSNRHIASIKNLVERGDRRFLLLETTFNTFTSMLPDVAPMDERELHQLRFRAGASN